ncbi:MAG: DUF2312 domain-containing protein [Pseudomonadota bacterium]
MSIGNGSGDRLRSFVERFERLQDEIDELKADQKAVMDEAKGAGFDVPTVKDILRLRKLERKHGRAALQERETLLDIYKAALGMLYDTPLGEAARRRLSQPKDPAKPGDERQGDIDDFAARHDEPEPEPQVQPEPPPPEVTVEDAREMGRQAAETGQPVTANPFPAHDPRRAAWDEAWCSAAGSDGMEIPEAWRRTKPKKDDKTEADGNAGAGDEKDAA